jgi:hypothetical protein
MAMAIARAMRITAIWPDAGNFMAAAVRIWPMGMINRNVKNASIPFIPPPEVM